MVREVSDTVDGLRGPQMETHEIAEQIHENAEPHRARRTEP